jgi:serine/threonine protein kinase
VHRDIKPANIFLDANSMSLLGNAYVALISQYREREAG